MCAHRIEADPDKLPGCRTLLYRYSFGPFALTSELEMAELREVQGTGRIAVRIELGPVAAEIPGTRAYDTVCSVGPRDYLLSIPDVARFHASDGSRVRVELAPGAARADVAAFLLGSVFGALCHQNGLLPLHASSVVWHAGVVAFLGNSGTGKSTLAACLQASGYRIFSDDICLLKESAGEMRAVPLAGWLKLWRQSLEHLAMRAEIGARVFAKEDKFRIALDGAQREPLPLQSLVFLARAEDGVARLLPLRAAEAVARMMEQVYLAYVPALNGEERRLFAQCGRALGQARAYRLELPWDLERMDEVLGVLGAELLR